MTSPRYNFQGQDIYIPPPADLTRAFWPDGTFAPNVQRAIDTIEPWDQGEQAIKTFDIARKLGAAVVEVEEDEPILWGVHKHHKANKPGLSPFVNIPDATHPRRFTYDATIHLVGTPDKPLLVRAYPGEYIAPLPWMMSAKDAPGGKEACREFWDGHAYIFRDHIVTDLTPQAPEWHRQSVESQQ